MRWNNLDFYQENKFICLIFLSFSLDWPKPNTKIAAYFYLLKCIAQTDVNKKCQNNYLLLFIEKKQTFRKKERKRI